MGPSSAKLGLSRHLEAILAPRWPKMTKMTFKMRPQSPPRRLQNRILAISSRILKVIFAIFGHLGAKIASRCQLKPNLAQLGPILGGTWPTLAASWTRRPSKNVDFP